jgi:hypothetical protein
MLNRKSQDVVPPVRKKTIRDIPIPNGRKKINNEEIRLEKNLGSESSNFDSNERETLNVNSVPPLPPVSYEKESGYQSSRWEDQEREKIEENDNQNYKIVGERKEHLEFGNSLKWILAIIILVLIIVFGVFIFARGFAIEISPKTSSISVNTEIEVKNIEEIKSDETTLAFAASSIMERASKTVEATGERKVSEKASGQIIVYNEYSEDDQKLIKETRFESQEGLIFRIPESIVVPGLKREENGNIIPGKIEVTVYADQTGEEYNIEKTKFTIPGFEGQPQFNSFYAESETNMTGGFDGVKKIISDSDKEKAEEDLRNELKEKIKNRVSEKNNDQFLALSNPNLEKYEFREEDISGNNVIINMISTSEVLLFEKSELSNILAERNISSFDSSKENVLIKNINDLDILISNFENNNEKEEEIGEKKGGLKLSIKGEANFVWQIDQEKLLNNLVGKSFDEIKTVIEKFDGISKIEVTKKPFWRKTFPENISKIKSKIVD